MPQASVGYEMDTIILYPTGANGITVLSNTRLQLNKEALKKIACTLAIFVEQGISIRNSTVSRGIWDKYREWYFKIHKNIMSRRSEWYLGSFEISWAGIYPKYPEETVLFFVYTTRQRNFALYVTHIFISSRAIDWVYNNMWLNMWSLKHHITLDKTVLECLEVSVLKGGSF